MIIIGFPGIGKSSVSNPFTGYVDLESSNFPKTEGWEKVYCDVALDLSEQGYYVFVSSHKQVRDYLSNYQSVDDIVEVFPEVRLCDMWIRRLTKRYSDTKQDKHKRALDYVSNHYCSMVADMENDDIKRKIKLTAYSNLYDLSEEINSYCVAERI